jgi:hypothetical protein
MDLGPSHIVEASGQAVDGHAALARKYHGAAVFYFGYGVYYLARIIALGRRSDWNLHGFSPALAWGLIFVGILITVAFPYFIWRQVRWFTVALAIVVFLRSVYLFSQGNVDFFLAPFLVTAAAAWMLARAAWDL